MTYVLIITFWMGGYVPGYHTTIQEFSSLLNCERAKKVLIEQTADGHEYQKAKVKCVEK